MRKRKEEERLHEVVAHFIEGAENPITTARAAALAAGGRRPTAGTAFPGLKENSMARQLTPLGRVLFVLCGLALLGYALYRYGVLDEDRRAWWRPTSKAEGTVSRDDFGTPLAAGAARRPPPRPPARPLAAAARA